MKILLVYTNTNRQLSPPPFGLAFLVPPLTRAGHQVKVLDLMFSKDPSHDLNEALATFRPDATGFSIRNLDNHDMAAPDDPLPAVRDHVAQVKSRGIPTILGGPGFTTAPQAMLRFMEADYGIAGQGEDALPVLLERLAGSSVDPSIAGLVWREGGTIRANPPIALGLRNKHPDWSAIDLRPYSRALFPAPIAIKTGCAFDCLYCDTPATCGSPAIPRDIDAILRDIRDVVTRTGQRRFYFVDPCLSHPVDFAKDLFRALIGERLGIHFGANLEPARGCYDDELFALYRRAGGCFAILGCESLSQTMLANYRKPFAIDDVLQWAQGARRAGLRFGVQLLFGGPGENRATVEETLERLPQIDFSIFLHGLGVRIYPRTGLQKIAMQEGVIRADDDLLFPRFYVSPQLDVAWARAAIRRATRRHGLRALRLLPVVLRLSYSRVLSALR